MSTKKRAFLSGAAALAASLLVGTAEANDISTINQAGNTADLSETQLEQSTPDFVIAPAEPINAQASSHGSHVSHGSHGSHESHSSHVSGS